MAAIWQNAPAISLENGCYDGLTTVSELRRHGDLGIGVFDQLDGEMVGVEGAFYQVTSDSKARAAAEEATLPFCMVTSFEESERHRLPGDITEEGIAGFLDEKLENENFFYTLRVDGTFDSLVTRSLPRQSKPFPPLAKVAETQPTFAYERAEGTMVGFRAPAYVGRVAPPGYHLHFIATDRRFGGHVLSFEGADATIGLERIDRQEILFPTTHEFPARDCGQAPHGFRRKT